MSLKKKLALVVIATFAGFTLTGYLVLRYVIWPQFIVLETQEAMKDVQRCAEAIRGKVSDLVLFAKDWSAWDKTYDFVAGENDDYIEDNLVPETFIDSKVSLLHFADIDRRVVWSQGRDPDANDVIEFARFSGDQMPESLLYGEHSMAGIIKTEHGPLLFSAEPILTNESLGPRRGTLIVGRLLDDDAIQILRDQVRIDFDVTFVDDVSSEQATPASELPTIVRHVDRLEASTTITGLTGDSLLIRAELSTEISNRGYTATAIAVAICVAGAIATTFILLVGLNQLVMDPISTLTKKVDVRFS